MARLLAPFLAASLLAAAPAAAEPDARSERRGPAPRVERPDPRRLARLAHERRIVWRASRSLGTPQAGALVDGVRLPPEGVHFTTWNPVTWRSPNAPARRFGSDRLVRTLLDAVARYAAANPEAPRVVVGDLSRPHGGPFDARYGIVGEFGPGRGTLGHVSHQNGLDVDVYYPRLDRRERAPDRLEEVDRALAQALVDAFARARPEFVFVGPRVGLRGPRAIVQALVRHDDHLHVRLRP